MNLAAAAAVAVAASSSVCSHSDNGAFATVGVSTLASLLQEVPTPLWGYGSGIRPFAGGGGRVFCKCTVVLVASLIDILTMHYVEQCVPAIVAWAVHCG
jgi:hypothetical protein